MTAPAIWWAQDHRRLWSLGEMLEHHAGAFYLATAEMLRLRETLKETLAGKGQTSLTALGREIAEVGQQVERHLLRIGTHVSALIAMELDHIAKRTPLDCREALQVIEQIDATLKRELTLPHFLVLEPSEKEKFAPRLPLFGREVDEQFPTEAAFDIDEAGKCLALGRPVAAVFHLMRVMESGLRAIARCLGIPDPVKPAERNWAFILKAVRAGIDAKWPTAAHRSAGDGQIFDDLHASLDAVKNPWRNAALHVDSVYTDDQAEHIFVAVRGFMMRLASRCDEDGEPKAP